MRIFWHNGALMIEPEDEQEVQLLTALTDNLRSEKPPEMQSCTSGSGQALGGDGFLKHLISNHEVYPGNFPRNLHHKQSVICINEGP